MLDVGCQVISLVESTRGLGKDIGIERIAGIYELTWESLDKEPNVVPLM